MSSKRISEIIPDSHRVFVLNMNKQIIVSKSTLKKPLKILVVHENSHEGGGQTYTDSIFKELQTKKNIEVFLLQDSSNFQVVQFFFQNKIQRIIWNIYTRKYILSILIARTIGIKNININYGFWFQESISVRWRKLSHREHWRLFKADLQRYFEQFFVYLLMHKILHLSEYGRSTYQRYFRILKKSEAILNPKLDYRAVTKIEKHSARKKLGIDVNTPILLMVGRVDARKNYHKAVQILTCLVKKKEWHQTQLLFVFTSSNDEINLLYIQKIFEEIKRTKLGKQVKIFSGISREELKWFYAASDALLMLSELLETFGLVTFEAISRECPVFGINACATPEIIGTKKKLFLVNRFNEYELAALIIDYFSKSIQKRNRIMKELREETQRKFQFQAEDLYT